MTEGLLEQKIVESKRNITRANKQDARPITYTKINKNLMHYPIARDPRTPLNYKSELWRQSAKTGRWLTNLPGEVRITLIYPKDNPIRRCPTGFDMLVLFTLIKLATLRGERCLNFENTGALLELMGLNKYGDNYDSLNDALELWQHLRIQFSDIWIQNKQKISKCLPPPLTVKEGWIHINKDWLQWDKYYFNTPMPLPRRTYVQNLIIWIFASYKLGTRENNYYILQPKTKRQLCRKIGLNNNQRNIVLRRSIPEVATWFKQFNYTLDMQQQGDIIVFMLTPPKAQPKPQERVKRKAQPERKPLPRIKRKARPQPTTTEYYNNKVIYDI